MFTGENVMVFFITFLRAVAACLITNAHYTGIYPSDIIANGGLLGDVIFFAVSGYCLYNIKTSFPRWYGKRIVRCYLPVLIITAVYFLLGFYAVSEGKNILWWFVYPTYYHFVASIVLLYIPYYIIMKIKWLRNRLWIVFGLSVLLHSIIYIILYDKSYYHIDNVREPMIWFLFFESMLLGAIFRQRDLKIGNKFHWYYPVILAVLCVVYFVTKTALTKKPSLSVMQILNQFVLLGVLLFVLLIFSTLNHKLEKFPKWLKKVISFMAKITLEIYVVQYVLIDLLRPIGMFPLNWLVITASIIVSASLLHFVCQGILWLFNFAIAKIQVKTQRT